MIRQTHAQRRRNEKEEKDRQVDGLKSSLEGENGEKIGKLAEIYFKIS